MKDGYNHSNQNQSGRVLIVGVMGNLVLALLKVGVGLLGYSKLILMDGLFSFANAVVLLLAWNGDKLERKPEDGHYPYGYGKFVFLTMAVSGLVVLIVAIYMFFYGLVSMTWLELHHSYTVAMMVSLISVAGNEALYHYLVGESRIHSLNVLAWNALNNRVNVCVSLLVLVFALLAGMGAPQLERLGVIAVSAVMFFMGLRVIYKAFAGFMDKIPPKKVLSRIKTHAARVKGVEDIQHIKARYVGTLMHLDIGIAVKESLTIQDADVIAREVERSLLGCFADIREVNVVLS